MMKVLDALDVQGPLIVVTHDIGNMVGYAFVALNRQRVTRWVVMDAPLPGIGHWDDQLKNPKTWHFNFRGPDVERLVAGRERIFLDRFWNELSANPAAITEPVRVHYAALYARPQAMHDAFEQFGAFAQDATDNQAFLAQGKLAMPVLAIGGDHSYGPVLGTEIGFAATDVKSVSIADFRPLADGRAAGGDHCRDHGLHRRVVSACADPPNRANPTVAGRGASETRVATPRYRFGRTIGHGR